jgi:hypothetical protein
VNRNGREERALRKASEDVPQKKAPLAVRYFTGLASLVFVAIVTALVIGIAARACLELFQFGWDLFSY